MSLLTQHNLDFSRNSIFLEAERIRPGQLIARKLDEKRRHVRRIGQNRRNVGQTNRIQ
jgi:hypothetical protein